MDGWLMFYQNMNKEKTSDWYLRLYFATKKIYCYVYVRMFCIYTIRHKTQCHRIHFIDLNFFHTILQLKILHCINIFLLYIWISVWKKNYFLFVVSGQSGTDSHRHAPGTQQWILFKVTIKISNINLYK